MIKIITYIIQKAEWRLSKKEHNEFDNTKPSEKVKLYRDLLDRIDKYLYGSSDLVIRHYRYFTIKIDEFKGDK